MSQTYLELCETSLIDFFCENIFEKKSSKMFDIVLNNILNVNMQEYNQKFIIKKQRRS